MFAEALVDTAGHAPAMPVFALAHERAEDVAAREALLDVAMGANRRRKASEAVRRGRVPAAGLSLVAKAQAGGLVGTVRLWNVAAGDDGRPALLLGPLAVAPSHAGLGIGSALMRRSITQAAGLGHAAVLLVGDPEYYGRFGVSAVLAAGLAMPGPFERHRLLGLELAAGALAGAAGLIRPTGMAEDEAAGDLARSA